MANTAAIARAEPLPVAETGSVATLTLGGGVDGIAPLAVIDARLDRTWRWQRGSLAVGLGARLRWRDGAVLTSDWDDARDLLAVVRYLEAQRQVGRAQLATALGPLVDVRLGRLVRGYTASIESDVIHPGVAAAVAWPSARIDVVVDDVTEPVVLGAAARIALASRWAADLGVAVDSGADQPMATAASAQIELGTTRQFARGVHSGSALVLASGGGGGAALLVDTGVTHRAASWRADLYVEGRAGSGDGAVAPIGPLTRVSRQAMRMSTTPGAWLGGAIGAGVTVDGLGEVTGEVRQRADIGLQGAVRVLAGAREPVQAGAWIAADDHALAVASELRVRWSPYTLSRIEATRSYARDADQRLTPRWQVMAWFGTAVAW